MQIASQVEPGVGSGAGVNLPQPATLTITNRASGEHRTFRLRAESWACRACAGRWPIPRCNVCNGDRDVSVVTLALLIGPENESERSYKPIACWHANGRFSVYSAYRNSKFGELARFVAAVVAGRITDQVREQIDMVRASRCRRCNRMLTTPESVAAGIGPECAARE